MTENFLDEEVKIFEKGTIPLIVTTQVAGLAMI